MIRPDFISRQGCQDARTIGVDLNSESEPRSNNREPYQSLGRWNLDENKASCYPRESNYRPTSKCVPNIKIGSFKGDSCLETFIAKFENVSAYLRWNSEDRLFHLRASLEGAAGQILWDAGNRTSAEDILRLLRSRFGNENQAERFRAELRARRRLKGESLQSLYNDICRLLVLAYPSPSNPTVAIVGRDAFLDALDNHTLRVRILEREPSSLETALNIASRLEAYEQTAPQSSSVLESFDDERGKMRSRHLKGVKHTESTPISERVDVDLNRQLKELRQTIEKNEQMKQQRWASVNCSMQGLPGLSNSSFVPSVPPVINQSGQSFASGYWSPAGNATGYNALVGNVNEHNMAVGNGRRVGNAFGLGVGVGNDVCNDVGNPMSNARLTETIAKGSCYAFAFG